MASIRDVMARLGPPTRPAPSNWYTAALNGAIEPPAGKPTRTEVSRRRVAGILEAAGERHVLLNLSSEGGNLDEAQRIAAKIERHGPGVTVRANGWCASAGLLVLAAGTHREAAPGTKFGFHGVGISDPPIPARRHLVARRLRAIATAIDDDDDRYQSYIARRCFIATATVRDWMTGEATLSARDALAAKLIHEITERRP